MRNSSLGTSRLEQLPRRFKGLPRLRDCSSSRLSLAPFQVQVIAEGSVDRPRGASKDSLSGVPLLPELQASRLKEGNSNQRNVKHMHYLSEGFGG